MKPTISLLAVAVIFFNSYSEAFPPRNGGTTGRADASQWEYIVPPEDRDCIDYQDYVHEIGTISTEGDAAGVTVEGGILYVAAGSAGLLTFDVSDPVHPAALDLIDTQGSAAKVHIDGSRGYVADELGGLAIVDVTDPDHLVALGAVDTPGNAVDVTSSGDFAYVADWDNGLVVVDATVPTEPYIALTIPLEANVRGVAISGSYVFVVCGRAMDVIDISNPFDPVSVQTISIVVPLGIKIFGDTAFLTCAGDPSGGYLCVMDITDPLHPAVLSYVGTRAPATSFTMVGATGFVIDAEGFLKSLNLDDLTYPRAIGGTRILSGRRLAIAGDVAYVAAGASGMKLVDVSNPSSPAVIGRGGMNGPRWVGGLAVSGEFAYFVVRGMDGPAVLFAYDLTDPAVPKQVTSIQVAGLVNSTSLAMGGAHVCVAACEDVGVVDVSTPTDPILVASIPTPGVARDVAVISPYALIADEQAGMQVISISNPSAPEIVASILSSGGATHVAVTGSLAIVANGNRALDIIDITSPLLPVQLGSGSILANASDVTAVGDHAYVSHQIGLEILDISDPASPQTVAVLPIADCGGVCAQNGRVYVAGGAGIVVVDIVDPAMPRVLGGLPTSSTEWVDVVVSDRFVCETGSTYGYHPYPEETDFYVLPRQCPHDGGACCHPDGSCTVTSEVACESLGIWQGWATVCDPNPCPPGGACCLADGICEMTTGEYCLEVGIWQGSGTTCDPNPCFTGACCFHTYCARLSAADCASYGGTYEGNGTLCEPNPCPTSAVEDAMGGLELSMRAIPNPSSGATLIQYALPAPTTITIELFDAAGSLVRRIEEGQRPAGAYTVRWDRIDESGDELPAGIYFARMVTGVGMKTGRVVVAR